MYKAAFLAVSSMLALAQQEAPFRAETRVIQIPVTVLSAAGRNVEGLRAEDFTVLDDSVKRTVSLDVFGSGAAPISLVVAIQSSGLSAPALAKIRRTGTLIQPLIIGRRGEAAILSFDSSMQWRQAFTGQPDRLRRAIELLKPTDDEQARVLDAVVEAASILKDRPGRRVLLLISEARDRGSAAKLERAIEAVERGGVQVFAAPYSAVATAFTSRPEQLPPPSATDYLPVFRELARLGKTNHLEALTQATGGSVYPFARQRSAEKAFENLGAEVHSQYILSFAQGAAAPGLHRLDVTIPSRPGLRVSARRAYFAD